MLGTLNQMEGERKFSLVQIFVFLGVILVLSGIIVPSVVQNIISRGGEDAKPADKQTPSAPILIDKFVPFIPKTFKMVIEFDTQTKKLSLKEFSILSEDLNYDPRFSALSPYKIVFYDKGGEEVSSFSVTVNEDISIHEMGGVSPVRDELSEKLSSAIYIPYNQDTVKLALFKDEQKVFEIPVSSYSSGQTNPIVSIQQACERPKIVVISDGYSDESSFNRDVDRFVAASNALPYPANFFDFQRYFNTVPLGCSARILSCLGSSAVEGTIQTARSATGASGAVILSAGGGTPAAYVGGEGPAVINTRSQVSSIEWQTAHEFLGHMTGWLWDRYFNQPGDLISGGLLPQAQSNCSESSSGQSWWPDAGSTGVYQGCGTLGSLYAPFSNTCPAGKGNPSTVMSLCGRIGFDSVEDYWIKTFRLPSLNCQTPPNVAKPLPTVAPTGGGGGAAPNPTQTSCSGPNQKLCGGTCFNVSSNCTAGWTCANGIPSCGPGSTQPANLSTTISWGALLTAAGGYEIVWVAGTTNTGTVHANGTSYTFNNLTKGSYSWKIWALDANGVRTTDNTGVGKLVGY